MSGSSKETASTSTSSTPLSREERFKALRSKLVASTKANHAEVIAEHKRMKIDPVSLSKLEHKKADAELKLSKQDAEEAGDDFERKRAWDWTMEESEKWDRRLAQKAHNRDQAGFAGITKSHSVCANFSRLYTDCRKVVQTGSQRFETQFGSVQEGKGRSSLERSNCRAEWRVSCSG